MFAMRKLIAFLLLFLFLLFIPNAVFAVDYSIELMKIEVQLDKKGNAFVTETQTYHFESSFNGISRTLQAKDNTRIIDYKAQENNEPLEVEFEEGTYKIYRSGKEGETVTIISTYTIEDAVELYNDAGQFAWSFFDSSNPSSYENVEIIIRPPGKTKDALVIGYNYAEDKETIQEDGAVHFKIGYLASESYADVQVAFDRDLFTGVTRIEEGSIKSQISYEVEKREKERQDFLVHQKRLESLAPYVLGGFFILLVLLFLNTRRRKRDTLLEMTRSYTEPYFAPDKIMSIPATIFYNSRKYINYSELIGVALLDLVRQGYVRQTDEEAFEVVHKDAELEHERFLIDWLFYKVDKEGVFTIEALKDYANNEESADLYQEDYTRWLNLVRKEIKESELTKDVLNFKIGLAVMATMLVGAGILYMLYDLIIPMWGSFALAILYGTFAAFYRPKTVKGKKVERDWEQFLQKYLQFEDQDWASLQDDEQRRAFLYSAGAKHDKIKDKNNEWLNRELEKVYDATDPMYFLVSSMIFTDYFRSAYTSAAEASSSGLSPTNFTGGGGGIGGSGGGSGAF